MCGRNFRTEAIAAALATESTGGAVNEDTTASNMTTTFTTNNLHKILCLSEVLVQV